MTWSDMSAYGPEGSPTGAPPPAGAAPPPAAPSVQPPAPLPAPRGREGLLTRLLRLLRLR